MKNKKPIKKSEAEIKKHFGVSTKELMNNQTKKD